MEDYLEWQTNFQVKKDRRGFKLDSTVSSGSSGKLCSSSVPHKNRDTLLSASSGLGHSTYSSQAPAHVISILLCLPLHHPFTALLPMSFPRSMLYLYRASWQPVAFLLFVSYCFFPSSRRICPTSAILHCPLQTLLQLSPGAPGTTHIMLVWSFSIYHSLWVQ